MGPHPPSSPGPLPGRHRRRHRPPRRRRTPQLVDRRHLRIGVPLLLVRKLADRPTISRTMRHSRFPDLVAPRAGVGRRPTDTMPWTRSTVTRVERSRAGAPRRRGTRTLTAVVSAALATAAVGCSSGDDGGADTTSVTPAPTTTQPRATTTVAQTTTTTPPEPSEPPTTETAPPTTTQADLEAQIAADYVRSWELRSELAMQPRRWRTSTHECAEIAAVGDPRVRLAQGLRRGARRAWRTHRTRTSRTIFSITVERWLSRTHAPHARPTSTGLLR